MTRLTDQLLLLAAQDERRLVGPREPVAVAELLAGVADRHRRAATGSGRAVEVTTAPGLVVYADRARLEGALDSLVENALRHGSGAIEITGVAGAGQVRLAVRDQGGGFAYPTFERFRRGPGSTGSGLGLAIVAAVAEAHDGQVRIGPASSVTITLPSGPSG